jgi:hypothetical protein
MISMGLPVAINKYQVYKEEIEKFGFRLPAINNTQITSEMVDATYKLVTEIPFRNEIVYHNLKVLKENLDHEMIVKKLQPVIKNIFTRKL